MGKYYITNCWILEYTIHGKELGFAQVSPDFWRLEFATLYFFELRSMDYEPGLSEREGTSLCSLPENESLVQFFCSLWLCDFLRLILFLNLSTCLDK